MKLLFYWGSNFRFLHQNGKGQHTVIINNTALQFYLLNFIADSYSDI